MLVAVAAGYTAGVVSQLAWPVLPSLATLACALAMALLAMLAARGTARCMAGGVAALALGMSVAAWQAGVVLGARLPHALEGSELLLEGRVASVSMRADGSMAFVLECERLPWAGVPWSPFAWQVRLTSWQPVAVQPGERWQWVARLQRPRAALNPGGSEFEQYLLGARVVASGSVRDDPRNGRVAPAGGWMAARSVLLAHLLPLLGDGPGDIAGDEGEQFARAVLPALLVDERGMLSGGQWRVLADTGTAHLVAISGLHVALLWGALLWLAARVLGRRPASLRYRVLAVLPATLVAVAYASLAGMPLPALRAALMLGVASLFLLAGGGVPVWRSLLAATLLVLVLDPLAVHATGFWLSYGAVALLLAVNELGRRPAATAAGPRWWQEAWSGLRMQALLTVLLAPALVWLFGTASTSSVLANLPAIPLVNLLALPPGLLGMLLAPVWPGGADLLVDLATLALSWTWHWLVWVDGWSLLAPLQLQGSDGLVAVALFAALLVLLFARQPALKLAVVLLAILAWPVAPRLAYGVAELCVLDVGQGLAVTVRTATRSLVYDTGPAQGAENDAGATVVVPAARALGMDPLDTLVLSGGGAEHAGGAATVLAALRPRQVVADDPPPSAVGAVPCQVARDWRHDGVEFHLWPAASAGARRARACVLHVRAGDQVALLPGDAGRDQQLALVAAWGDRLRADLLVAPSHGGRDSLSTTFLYRVEPARVIFPVGHRNRATHPHPDVVAALRRQGASLYDTARHGALCTRLGETAGAPPVQAARQARRRFWLDRVEAGALPGWQGGTGLVVD